MKYYRIVLVVLLLLPYLGVSQDTEEEVKKDKPQRAAFQSDWLINNPTNIINTKNTFEFSIQHRFGTVNGGTNDLIGIWAPSNIRLGFNYTVTDRVNLGFGTTKDNRLQDFNLKVAVLRQTRSGSMPISLTYYGNMAIDARSSDNFYHSTDRFSYFNSIIIARRFSPNVSIQVIPSFSHFNLVDSNMKNDQLAVALGGRVKVSSTMAILVDYSQPLSQDTDNPGLSLALEISTGSHAFQVFVGNYKGIVPQQNYMFNPNRLADGDILIGFNITRLWNF